MCRKSLPWMAFCAWLLLATIAWADGVMLDGLSPRAIGRGGTNLGFADNGAVFFDNPGAMVNVEGDGLVDLGVNGLIASFSYTDPANSPSHSTTFTPLPQIALIKKSEDGVWAYGFGVFTPAGFSEQYTLNGPFPLLGPRDYKSFGALMKFLPGLSCRLTDKLSIGGTFGVGVSYAYLVGPYFIQSGPLTGTPTILHTQGTGATPVYSAGLQYQWTDDTTFGATYQSASNFHLAGNTNVAVPLLGNSEYDSDIRIKWPQSVGVGVRHQLCPHRVVAADVVWFDWPHAFNEFGLTLHNPTNPFFPPFSDAFPLHWQDSISAKLGFEQVLTNGNTLRLGYVYHPNPITNPTLTPYLQAILQHAVTIGYGWTFDCWNMDVSWLHSFGPSQTEGASQLVGGDFDNSHHWAQVDALSISFIRPF